jgi:hypothetical protein
MSESRGVAAKRWVPTYCIRPAVLFSASATLNCGRSRRSAVRSRSLRLQVTCPQAPLVQVASAEVTVPGVNSLWVSTLINVKFNTNVC